MGNPLVVSIPTKVSHEQGSSETNINLHLQVSQNWFPVSERLLATAVLALSLPLGIVCGQGISPAFVKEASDVPTMNLVRVVLSTSAGVVWSCCSHPDPLHTLHTHLRPPHSS